MGPGFSKGPGGYRSCPTLMKPTGLHPRGELVQEHELQISTLVRAVWILEKQILPPFDLD